MDILPGHDSPHPYGLVPAGYRLPDTTHVGAVRLQVRDLAVSVPFYEQVLGLRVSSSTGDTATLTSQGGTRPLVHLQARPGISPAPRRGAYGLFHFAILLPDREALGRFVVHLATLGLRAGSADHLVSEALYLSDPDGLGIEVYADRPRATWRHHGRELVMATDPLDVEGLAAAGGTRPWEGAPVGTTMGHVHLHVGDIAEAKRFYHAALGLDVMVSGYPGALFMAAGGYHHHLGTNTWSPGPSATDGQARLLDWELVLPTAADAAAAAHSVQAAGFTAAEDDLGWFAVDPWGTRLRLRTP